MGEGGRVQMTRENAPWLIENIISPKYAQGYIYNKIPIQE